MGNLRKIHVIIPVYNAKSFLHEAVTTITNQPYKNIEILLIDDGSTDGSSELCDTIVAENDNVRVIHQKNLGVSAARNAGIDSVLSHASDDDYIAFCDADDLWVKNAIGVNFFDECENEELILFNMIGATQNLDGFRVLTNYAENKLMEPYKLIWDWSNYFVSYLYSCRLIRKYEIRFSTLTRYCEDRMFLSICLSLAKKLRICEKYLYVYRYNGSSAMHTLWKNSKISYFKQIIDGWIETDLIINRWEQESGKYSTMGHTLASIYFLDMAAEHYQQWGSKKILEGTQQSHPFFYLLENMSPNDVSNKQYREQQLMLKYPKVFKLKHNLLGIIVWGGNVIYKVKLVKKLYLRRKYPNKFMPVNG